MFLFAPIAMETLQTTFSWGLSIPFSQLLGWVVAMLALHQASICGHSFLCWLWLFGLPPGQCATGAREGDEMRHNRSPQQTLDPAGSPAAARAPSPSIAAESA